MENPWLSEIEKEMIELTELRLSSFSRSCIQIVFIPLFILVIVVSFFIGIILAFGAALTLAFFSALMNWGTNIGNTVLGFIPGFVLLGTILLGFYKTFILINKIDPIVGLKKKVENLIELYKESLTDKTEDIETILLRVQEIYKYAKYLSRLSKMNFLFTKMSKGKILQLLKISLLITQTILSDLRSDLVNNLRIYHTTLAESKTALGEIAGTPGLEEISELQKTRIDRQIEQFGELQRVLVKI